MLGIKLDIATLVTAVCQVVKLVLILKLLAFRLSRF